MAVGSPRTPLRSSRSRRSRDGDGGRIDHARATQRTGWSRPGIVRHSTDQGQAYVALCCCAVWPARGAVRAGPETLGTHGGEYRGEPAGDIADLQHLVQDPDADQAEHCGGERSGSGKNDGQDRDAEPAERTNAAPAVLGTAISPDVISWASWASTRSTSPG